MKTKSVTRAATGLLAISLSLIPQTAMAAGGIGRAAARGATRGVSRSLRRSSAQALRRDLLRDRAAPVARLARDRRVVRYTSIGQARREMRTGIPPNRHLTARAPSGRPPAGTTVQRRYGLPRKPTAAEHVLLRKETPVKMNKATGGKPGYGEILSQKRIPKRNVLRITPVR
jgi:hypothetical protein